ncbi:MAG: TonB-dependent receptor [Spirochaetia bacterium]|nr:TonB-dependent receptor [Spirochaetia bacterium]
MKKIRNIFIVFLFSSYALWAQEAAPQAEQPKTAEEQQNIEGNEEADQPIAEQEIDEVSITATRVKRNTLDVPASMTVVGEEEIEDMKMHNIKDALTGTAGVQIDTKSRGSSTRVVIRGAGAKAAYGVREIMFLLNGVPITDPDGFSKLDAIDPLQIERIEVVKGPNSTLWGANATGGIVHIITKDPIKQSGGYARVSGGNYGMADASLYYGAGIGESFVYSLNGSYRRESNDWRDWNNHSAFNVTFQPGFIFKDGTTWQNYVTFNQSDTQLAGTLNEDGFEEYKKTGKAPETESLWRRSGRYADTLLFNSKLTKEMGSFTFKPMIYLTRWSHYHPVYSGIGVSKALVGGLDIQVDQNHSFSAMAGTLTFGASARFDDQDGIKYRYNEIDSNTVYVSTDATGVKLYKQSVLYVHGDGNGKQLNESNTKTWLGGLYLQESFNMIKSLTLDLGLRYDIITFDHEGTIQGYYSHGEAAYYDCPTVGAAECGESVLGQKYSYYKDFQDVSPRGALSYRIIEPLSVFASIARGIQTPTSGEIGSNPDLDIVKSTNYEIGFKGRGKSWDFDMSTYYNLLENEVVAILNTDGTSEYKNAGQTEKVGFELDASYNITKPLSIGGTFTYNDHRYKEFVELVRDSSNLIPFDRAGNKVAFSPDYMYSIALGYKTKGGFKAKVKTDTWGPYYMDHANSEFYDGYSFVTSAMIGYEYKNISFMVNGDNILNKFYAVEVKKASKKDNTGAKSYAVAPPLSLIGTVSYKF